MMSSETTFTTAPIDFVTDAIRLLAGGAASSLTVESYTAYEGDTVFVHGELPPGLYQRITRKRRVRRGHGDACPVFACGRVRDFELCWVVGAWPRAVFFEIGLGQLSHILGELAEGAGDGRAR